MEKLEMLQTVEKLLKNYKWEIYLLSTKKLKSSSKNFQIENLINSEDTGIGIRVYREGHTGFSYTTNVNKDNIERAVEKAIEISRISSPEEFIPFKKLEKIEQTLEEYDSYTAEKIKAEEKINLPIEIEYSLRKKDSRIKNIRDCSFSETIFQYKIINSEGLDISEKGTIYTVSISPVAEENGNFQIVWGFTQSRYLKDLDLDGTIEETVKNAINLLNAKPIQTTKMYINFPPYAFSQLLEVFYPAFSGEFLIKNKNKLNIEDKAGVETLNIIDDGKLLGGIMTRSYDDEGVPTKKTYIIKSGIMKNFLHNLYTASQVKAESTGNGFRNSYKDLPSIKPSNLFVDKGNKKINYPDRYFHVVEMLGLHTSNPVTGDFSVGVSGFIVENGEIVQPVNSVTLSGNFFELLKSIIQIGNDLKFYGNFGSPSILVDKMMIGGV